MKSCIQENVKFALLVIGLLSTQSIVAAQGMNVGVKEDGIIIEDVKFKGDEIFIVVEENPKYPGGPEKLKKFIKKEFKYPTKSINEKIEGKVYVEFIVHEDGNLTDIKPIRGLSKELDAEACRVVEKMKKWSPGRQRGKPVKVRFTLPMDCKIPVKKKSG